MDDARAIRHNPDMTQAIAPPIPAYALYGEDRPFPDILHIEGIRARAAGLDWAIAPHRHLHLHQFILVTSGRVRLTIATRKHDLVPPALVSIPRGMVHGFIFEAGTEGYVLTVPVREVPNLLEDGAETARALSRLAVVAADDDCLRRMQEIATVHGAPGPFRATRLRALVTGLACHILDLSGADPETAPPRRDPRLIRFESLVWQHYRERWSPSDYARAMAISLRHLTRLCRDGTGLSVQGYIDALTFREACNLLVYTRMGVAEAGYHLGFDDPSYFSRAFRRHVGFSPGAYRARFDG